MSTFPFKKLLAMLCHADQGGILTKPLIRSLVPRNDKSRRIPNIDDKSFCHADEGGILTRSQINPLIPANDTPRICFKTD